YLQLLTEAVARYVLRELGLPVTNIIYLGGGNFFLLAPMRAQERLPAIQQEVSRRLLAAHEGGLHLALGWSPVRAGEFRVGCFAGAWKALHRELRKTKNRPLAYLDDDILSRYLGGGMGAGGDRDMECSVCGREEKGMEEEEGIRKCKHCRSFEALGNALAKAKWLVSAHFAPQALPEQVEDWHAVLQSFGMDFWAVEDLRQAVVKVKPAVMLLTPLKGDDVKKGTSRIEGVTQVEVYRFFPQLVPWCEQSEKHICTFDELCEASTGGFKRWGVLRMDVDNLSLLFQEEGFTWKDSKGDEVKHLTLSRVASLSFALRLFFEGLLPGFAGAGEHAALMRDRLYLQYAGGDDVFLVGSWDALPIFALEVQKGFRQFVCENPCVTISAGIALAPEKYPLYQAADDAGKAEELAKRWERNGQSGTRKKDAFHFLGFTMDWQEVAEAWRWAWQFSAWCTADPPKAPKALVQLLLNLYVGYAQEREQAVRRGRCAPAQVYFGPWMWRLAYYMARRRSDSHMPEEVKQEL
ncbi:MAG: type III-A CRISPR-associated protein Cas10/Csm1, partial [Anaerolineae bacterium]|nr:type III-A CRISPR-associated protein Cas10/Csm1 [Anaerolineae bacterium]